VSNLFWWVGLAVCSGWLARDIWYRVKNRTPGDYDSPVDPTKMVDRVNIWSPTIPNQHRLFEAGDFSHVNTDYAEVDRVVNPTIVEHDDGFSFFNAGAPRFSEIRESKRKLGLGKLRSLDWPTEPQLMTDVVSEQFEHAEKLILRPDPNPTVYFHSGDERDEKPPFPRPRPIK